MCSGGVITLSYIALLLAVRGVAFLLPVAGAMSGDKNALAGLQRPLSRPADAAATTAVADVNGAAAPASSSPAVGASTAGGGRGSSGNQQPSHLVVLVHGLAGTPEDLTYLKESLERRGGEGVLVHLARCNLGKTKDGVAEGGSRLAEEVLDLVDSTPSLSRISLVGNSLGGLYARYAAKLLYRPAEGGLDAPLAGDGGNQTTDGAARVAATAVVAPAAARDIGAPHGDMPPSPPPPPTAQGEAVAASAAATEIEKGGGGTMAGLKPSVFMTIATPHLGVRRFTYVPVPSSLQPLAGVFVGKTGSDLFLSGKAEVAEKTSAGGSGDGGGGGYFSSMKPRFYSSPTRAAGETSSAATLAVVPRAGVEGREEDCVGAVDGGDSGEGGDEGNGELLRGRGSSLLYDMATSEDFLGPLKAFRWRRVYANRRGDFMVPYETAAFVEPNEGDGSDASPGERFGAGAEAGDEARGADTGAGIGRKTFTVAEQVLGAKQGAIVGVSRVLPPACGSSSSSGGGKMGNGSSGVNGPRNGRTEPVASVSRVEKLSNKWTGRAGLVARIGRAGAKQEGEKKTVEEEMAAGLNSCGWEKVSVDFGGLMPFSHNKICALSRSSLTRAVYSSGKTIVEHAADFVISRDSHDDNGSAQGGHHLFIGD